MSCEVCEQTDAKYKCPGCSIKTCGLHCVKRHKAVNGCSGVRNKTAYVPMKEFSDRHLLNDYRFLEDVDRKAYSAITDNTATQHQHRDRFRQLRNWCKVRKTWLKLLPPSFSRHKENTTWINRREKLIYWRVHWIFPQSQAEYVDKSVCEDRTLCDILSTHLGPVKGDPAHRQRLKKYCQQGLDELHLYMKVEGRPANSVRYHKLDLNGTLRVNLQHKSLVEFPSVHVVLKESTGTYETMEQDQNTNQSLPASCVFPNIEGAAAPAKTSDAAETPHSVGDDPSEEAPPLNTGPEDSGKDLGSSPQGELHLEKEVD